MKAMKTLLVMMLITAGQAMAGNGPGDYTQVDEPAMLPLMLVAAALVFLAKKLKK